MLKFNDLFTFKKCDINTYTETSDPIIVPIIEVKYEVADLVRPTATAALIQMVTDCQAGEYTMEDDSWGGDPSISLFYEASPYNKADIKKSVMETFNKLYESIKIIGVTVSHGDLVIALPKPNRHYHVINHMVDVLGITPPIGHGDQGFYLSDGTYLNREAARDYALVIGQVETTDHDRELFSEDLW